MCGEEIPSPKSQLPIKYQISNRQSGEGSSQPQQARRLAGRLVRNGRLDGRVGGDEAAGFVKKLPGLRDQCLDDFGRS